VDPRFERLEKLVKEELAGILEPSEEAPPSSQ